MFGMFRLLTYYKQSPPPLAQQAMKGRPLTYIQMPIWQLEKFTSICHDARHESWQIPHFLMEQLGRRWHWKTASLWEIPPGEIDTILHSLDLSIWNGWWETLKHLSESYFIKSKHELCKKYLKVIPNDLVPSWVFYNWKIVNGFQLGISIHNCTNSMF